MSNQPAFPIADPFAVKCPLTEGEALNLQQGMTLRDYFAAKVINGALPLCSTYESAATVAYMIADAMLKARQE